MMKQFIDKLISRLYELKNNAENRLSQYMDEGNLPYTFDISDIFEDKIETIGEAISIVNQLAEEYKGGWIPCSEKMPEEPEENPELDYKPLELYLVSIPGTKYPFRAFWNGKFFTDGWDKVDAVAWMPLPSPYDGKEEYKPRTNADEIRNMSDEEQKKRPWCARDECVHFEEGGSFCTECFIAWFMSDVKDGE